MLGVREIYFEVYVTIDNVHRSDLYNPVINSLSRPGTARSFRKSPLRPSSSISRSLDCASSSASGERHSWRYTMRRRSATRTQNNHDVPAGQVAWSSRRSSLALTGHSREGKSKTPPEMILIKMGSRKPRPVDARQEPQPAPSSDKRSTSTTSSPRDGNVTVDGLAKMLRYTSLKKPHE